VLFISRFQLGMQIPLHYWQGYKTICLVLSFKGDGENGRYQHDMIDSLLNELPFYQVYLDIPPYPVYPDIPS
jgi:hypothetical protein